MNIQDILKKEMAFIKTHKDSFINALMIDKSFIIEDIFFTEHRIRMYISSPRSGLLHMDDCSYEFYNEWKLRRLNE